MVVWLKQWQQESRRKNGVERDGRVNGTIYLDVGGKGEEGYKMILSFIREIKHYHPNIFRLQSCLFPALLVQAISIPHADHCHSL